MNKKVFQERVEEFVREGAVKSFPPEWMDGKYRWTLNHTLFEPDALHQEYLNEYILTCADTSNLALRHRAFIYDYDNQNWRVEIR